MSYSKTYFKSYLPVEQVSLIQDAVQNTYKVFNLWVFGVKGNMIQLNTGVVQYRFYCNSGSFIPN